MAQLAVAIAFTVLTRVLFPPKDTRSEGPRLHDQSVSSSAYGQTIPIGAGTVRLAGNLIWAGELIETPNEQTSGGKGLGGPKHTQTTYTYSRSFAMSLSEGVAEDVIRIWANNKIIYDKNADGDIENGKFKFRFYSGSEDQLVDSIIEADKGADTPAHRGLCYIVFDDMQLLEYGNRIPSLHAEIAFSKAPSYPLLAGDPITQGEGGIFESDDITLGADGHTTVNWKTRRVFAWQSDSGVETDGFRVLNMDSMKEIQQRKAEDIGDLVDYRCHSMYADQNSNFLYMTHGVGPVKHPILKIDQNSLKEVGRFGVSSGIGLNNDLTGFLEVNRYAMVRPLGLLGEIPFLMTGSTVDGWVGLIDTRFMEYVFGIDGEVQPDGDIRGMVTGKTEFGFGEGWVVVSGTNSVRIYKMRVSAAAFYDPITSSTRGVEFDLAATINDTDLGYEVSDNITYYDPIYSASDDTLILYATGNVAKPDKMVKWSPVDGIKWIVNFPDGHFINNNTSFGYSQSNITNPFFAIGTSGGGVGNFHKVNLDNGSIVWSVSGTESGWNDISSRGVFYDGVSDSIISEGATDGLDEFPLRHFLDRASGDSVTLQSVIESLCTRAGLNVLTDVEFVGFTSADVVRGFFVGRSSSIAASLALLGEAHFFDVVESDDKIKFVKKSTTPVATITENEMIRMDSDEGSSVLKESRVQEIELPERQNVLYLDLEADHQQGAQHFKRISSNGPTMFSRQQSNLDLPMVLTPTEAKRIAEVQMFSKWMERSTYECQLPWKFLKYDPTDVVTLKMNDGQEILTRVTALNMDADFTLKFSGVKTSDDLFNSTTTGSVGGFQKQKITGGLAAPFSKLFLMNTPLLRSGDDTGGVASRFYLAVGAFKAGFQSSDVFKSFDGSGYDLIAGVANEVTWGTTSEALGATNHVFATDTVNTIRVYLATDGATLSSITTTQLLAGGNPLLVGDEIVQFRDAALQADGSYLLSHLLRGRRGTEWAVRNHTAGEEVVVLTGLTVFPMSNELEDIGKTRFYRAVSAGQLFEDSLLTSQTWEANDLKPYAPVNFKRTNVSADTQIDWLRRDRIFGPGNTAGDIPLSETTEQYEVYILKAAYDAATFDPTNDALFYYKFDGSAGNGAKPTDDTVTWTSANYNGFTQTDPLHLAVFQISAVAGRGFAGTATLAAP